MRPTYASLYANKAVAADTSGNNSRFLLVRSFCWEVSVLQAGETMNSTFDRRLESFDAHPVVIPELELRNTERHMLDGADHES